MNTELIQKLKTKYPNAEFTRLAVAGDMAGAQRAAAGVAWGIWAEIGAASGLPCDDAARNAWIAEQEAKRKARFARK